MTEPKIKERTEILFDFGVEDLGKLAAIKRLSSSPDYGTALQHAINVAHLVMEALNSGEKLVFEGKGYSRYITYDKFEEKKVNK